MTALHSLAYKLDPALWVKEVVKIEPAPWQRHFMSAPRGASILALTARQVGKTTTAAWAIAHQMMFFPGSLSIIVCPAQRQSAEAVRRIREVLLATKAEFANDNVYGLELKNGSRVMALPSTDDSVRGLTVTGWIIFDEAARLSEDLIAAVRPMRARQPATRLAMLSTAWSRTDPFWTAWTNEDADWIRFKMTADMPDCPLSPEQITKERVALSSHEFKREYLGIPAGGVVSPFGWELYDRATRILARSQRNAPVFNSRVYNDTDVASWPLFKPIIAHDVARSRDRSTAVVGGNNPMGPRQLGILSAHELPQTLFGSARASALAAIDQGYNCSSLIVADLSYDPSYAENLLETFPGRVVGLQISRYGDGMGFERRFTNYGTLLVYKIGRSFLLELLHREFDSDLVRLANTPDVRRGYEQLANLELEHRDAGAIYRCPVGQHDDLGISYAMLAWAARHQHLKEWMRSVEATRRPPKIRAPAGNRWAPHI
jgi:hypothetical protein